MSARGAALAMIAAACVDAREYRPAGDGAAGDDAKVADAPGPDAPVDARVCPPGPNGCMPFDCGGTSCHYLCTNDRNWAGAQNQCMTVGGCLVTIDDEAENQCVQDHAAPTFPDLVWIGWVQEGGAAEPAGGWGWVCGSSTFVASNWGAFEPNNQSGEDCGAMSGGAWGDLDCASAMRFVCEVP